MNIECVQDKCVVQKISIPSLGNLGSPLNHPSGNFTKMSIDIKSFSNGNSMVGQQCKTDLYFLQSQITTTNKGQRYTVKIPIQNKFKMNPSIII